MPSALVPLANLTLSATQSIVNITSISGIYRDLLVVFSGTATTNGQMQLRFNSDSGTNYNWVEMAGDGSGTYSASDSNQNVLRFGYSANYLSTSQSDCIIHIMDYAATDKHKTVIARSGSSGTGTNGVAGRWASTSAITDIQLRNWAGGSFNSGSTFAIYGVSA